MYKEVLNELLSFDEKEKDTVCLSILLPLQNTLPERGKNPLVLKQAVKKARERLILEYPKENNEALIKRLDEITAHFVIPKDSWGIGIYLSSTIEHTVSFPFPVPTKIIIDKTFETRELVYAHQSIAPHWVVSLDSNKARLYKGEGFLLKEIIDEDLPLQHEEQYQFPDRQKPRISGDYQSEESQIKDERQRQFYRHYKKLIDPYLNNDTASIVLSGIKSNHQVFEKIFDKNQRVVAHLYGNHEHLSVNKMASLVWPLIRSHNESENEKLITEIEEKIGKRGYLYGIEAVWRIAREGRAELVVVEKDYSPVAYQDPQTGRLLFSVSDPSGLTEKADPVDDVIELVLNKSGQVRFVENGKLENYNHIAVKTRY